MNTYIRKLFSFLILFQFSMVFCSVGQIQIGKQTWMDKNLDVRQFRNGDWIPEAKTAQEWETAGKNRQPAWCYYNNDSATNSKNGKLYNWFAVNDTRGLAPKGWRVASTMDWSELLNNLGGAATAGDQLKSTSSSTKSGKGQKSSGFSASLCGFRQFDGTFGGINYAVHWWTSTSCTGGGSWDRSMIENKSSIDSACTVPHLGYSVRCLR